MGYLSASGGLDPGSGLLVHLAAGHLDVQWVVMFGDNAERRMAQEAAT
jgi:hypothetical protein